VFRAYDPDRAQLVAVKRFTFELPPERRHQLVAAFDSLVAADLTHPAIASPVAAGVAGASVFLAQDYVSAETFDHAVREYGHRTSSCTSSVSGCASTSNTPLRSATNVTQPGRPGAASVVRS